MRKLFGVCLLGLFTLPAMAAGIRTVYVNSKKMQTIYLKMGQATVLRFREKPKKVILGNSNYHSVEFIDSDLTIQPQGIVNTNLFVYGEYHTFGFNLKVIHQGRFDDLVNIRWKSPRVSRIRKGTRKKLKTRFKKVDQSFSLEKGLRFHILEVQQNDSLNSTIIDLEVENISKKEIETSKISVSLTRSKKVLKGQQVAFMGDEIRPSKKTRLRLLIRPKQTKGFSIEAELGGKKVKKIVSRAFL